MAKKSKKNETKPDNKNNKETNKSMIYVGIFALLLLIIAGAYLYQQSNSGDEEIGEEENMNPIVVLETNKGNIKIQLDKVNAPVTTDNFIKYVEAGHYDGLIFHRVIPNFMVQGGGFHSNGTQKSTRAPIVLESNNNLSNTRGTIAMARTPAPNSATSQFFINVVDNQFLNYAPGNPGYAVFGKVIEGMNVVDEIRYVETRRKSGNDDWPVEDVVITKAYVQN